MFSGSQLSTAAFAVIDGAHVLPTNIAAEAQVYLSTAIDDATQDSASVWVVYQDDTGAIQTPIETVLHTTESTEVSLGCEAAAQVDTVNGAAAGQVVTMTALVGTNTDDWAGYNACCIAGDNEGTIFPITASSKNTPCTLTLTGTLTDIAADVLSVQTYYADDFFRVREMYSAVEVADTKEIRLGDLDSSNLYGHIGVGHRYMAKSGIFTQPTATCDTYLGRIRGSFPSATTATKNTGAALQIFYTPFEAHSDGGAVETEIEIPFQGDFTWEPCIKLAPATDVTIKIKKINDALHDEVFVEASYLEVYK